LTLQLLDIDSSVVSLFTNRFSFLEKFRSLIAEAVFPVGIAWITGLLTLILGFAFSWTISGTYPDSFRAIWIRWDTVHYLAIATSGYAPPENPKMLICFFPLYPALIAAGTVICRDSFISGLLVSNGAFACALVFLRRLVALDFDRKTTHLAVLFCAFFPTAYFYHLVYTESLFLALLAGCLYCARTESWWWAGILALLATLTRLPGVVLIPVLLLEYCYQRGFRWHLVRMNILATLLPTISIMAYLALNQHLFGDPFTFLGSQKTFFFREFASPFSGWLYDYNNLLTRDVSERFTMSVEQMFCFVASLPLLVWSALRLRPSYTLLTALFWVLTFCYSFWMSVPRLMMMFLPMYFVLGKASSTRPLLRDALLFASVMLYTFGTIQFSMGNWAH
jgi:hypothetical protein